MRRTQIQLDETTYEMVRRRAFSEGKSMAAVVREALTQCLAPGVARPLTMDSLTFIGSGRSKSGDPRPLSERHDEALVDDFAS
jgi:plasmid stability protein